MMRAVAGEQAEGRSMEAAAGSQHVSSISMTAVVSMVCWSMPREQLSCFTWCTQQGSVVTVAVEGWSNPRPERDRGNHAGQLHSC